MSRCERVHGFCHGDTETQRRTSNAETAKPAEKRAKSATMSRCDCAHGFCHGDTETQRRTSNAETAKPAEKRAKFATMSRCDRVHGFCHGDTETRRSGAHAGRRARRRTQAGAAGLLSGQTDGRKRKPIALGVCVSARPHARAAAMRRRATRCQLCVSVSLARIFFVRLRDLRAFVVSLVPRSISRRNRTSTNLTAPAHCRKLHGCPPFIPREKTCRARSASSCV